MEKLERDPLFSVSSRIELYAPLKIFFFQDMGCLDLVFWIYFFLVILGELKVNV
jgi:hypothetical protein